MNRKDLYNAVNEVDDEVLERSETASRNKKKPVWLKWGAIAACLCLIVSIAIPLMSRQPAEIPNDTNTPGDSPGDGPSSLVVNGTTYLVSSHLSHSSELPAGFVYAGDADVGGFEACPYYTNPDFPEWVYVYQEVKSGTAYVRYVDVRLRGKNLVCYNGAHYISMWRAEYYGKHPDVTKEYYDTMKNTYGIRIEGDVPDGFVSVGVAEFSGHDTIPKGTLSSNEGPYEVFANPAHPDVVLVETQWYTAAAYENEETKHSGFNVYIRYNCPLG